MTIVSIISAKEAGRRLGITHHEVIRRIRRGEIVAQKLDWNWIINVNEVERVKESEWYLRLKSKNSA